MHDVAGATLRLHADRVDQAVKVLTAGSRLRQQRAWTGSTSGADGPGRHVRLLLGRLRRRSARWSWRSSSRAPPRAGAPVSNFGPLPRRPSSSRPTASATRARSGPSALVPADCEDALTTYAVPYASSAPGEPAAPRSDAHDVVARAPPQRAGAPRRPRGVHGGARADLPRVRRARGGPGAPHP